MLTPANLALVATIAAYCVAAARLFNLAKPLYGWIPSRYQPIAIALGAGLPQLAEALATVTTKQQLVTAVGSGVVAFLVSAKGAPHDPPGGGSGEPPVHIVLDPPPPSVRPPGGVDAPMVALPWWAFVESQLRRRGLVLVSLLLMLACAPVKPPCNEAKMRAIDVAYLKALAEACLQYPSAQECPDYPRLKAQHSRELMECPQ